MGDSTCVLHAYPHESTQGNMMHGLTDSVSLGRFMSEQLSWEKWSTFSSNRYVEEAERYAQPGSVAQKKAFFEAHYKKIAAQKAAAAAAAEQAKNSGVSDGTNHDAAPEAVTVTDTVTAPPPPPLTSMYIHPTTHDHRAPPPPPPPEKEKVEEEALAVKEEEPSDVIAPPESEKPLLLHQNSSSEREVSSAKMKKKSAFSSLKSSVYRKTSSKIPVSTPARLPQVKKQGGAGANCVSATTTSTTKIKKKPALDFTEKKNLAPKSPLQLLVNSSPVKQLTQLLSPSRKTDSVGSSRIAPDFSKMSQNCKTPVATQNMMSRHSAAVATTPCPADTRTRTPADGNKTAGPKRHILSTLCSKSLTACRNKLQSPTLSTPFLLRTEERAARRKQKLEEKFNSKKDDVGKVKVQPPQTTFKEKAESELRKLQQSFCFKARPLPDFYKEREAQNNQIKKNPVAQPQSPKLGRKANSSRTAKNAVALPKSAQVKKNGNLKHVSASSSLQEMIDHENSSPNIQA